MSSTEMENSGMATCRGLVGERFSSSHALSGDVQHLRSGQVGALKTVCGSLVGTRAGKCGTYRPTVLGDLTLDEDACRGGKAPAGAPRGQVEDPEPAEETGQERPVQRRAARRRHVRWQPARSIKVRPAEGRNSEGGGDWTSTTPTMTLGVRRKTHTQALLDVLFHYDQCVRGR